MLPSLLALACEARADGAQPALLVATSGDTGMYVIDCLIVDVCICACIGAAALDGFARAKLPVAVLYPVRCMIV